jgi:hypothetical protein
MDNNELFSPPVCATSFVLRGTSPLVRYRGPQMKLPISIAGLFLLLFTTAPSLAQTPTAEQQLIELSKQKWQWMAEKNVEKLEPLFHEKSKFVHMSGTWKKVEELDIIKTGRIWYRQADVHDVAVEVVKDTAVVWSRITLDAHVRGSDVKTEFTVTEVFVKQRREWKLLALTFSSVRDTHKLEK